MSDQRPAPASGRPGDGARRPVLLLVNPVAGGKLGSGPDLADDPELLQPTALAAALRKRGLEVELHELSEDDDAAALAVAADDGGRDVVVAGGDGTVGAVAAALCGRGATLGILPRGSFNNVARGSGVPLELDPALDAIGAGDVARIDAGVAQVGDREERFFEAAGVGLDADGFGAVEAGERRSALTMVTRAWRALRRRRSPMRITLDGRTYRTGAPAVTISNGPYHGFGFALAPEADPQDGLFDVAIFTGMSRLDVLLHFVRVARHRPVREPRMIRRRAAEVRVEGQRRQHPVHVDGRSVGRTPAAFRVDPGALRLFRPASVGDRQPGG